MKVAIMQPYIFPYIGYFQLVEAVDLFIIYDDVQYIKRGWINRNRILLNGSEYLFTVPCVKPSQTKLIKDVELDWQSKEFLKLRKTVELAYSRAPYYNQVKDLVHGLLTVDKECSIADFATKGIVEVSKYLSIQTEIKRSSALNYDNLELKKGDRLIDIVKKEGATEYINAIGGQEIYTKEYFLDHGVSLSFLKPLPIDYKQFNSDFVPWLSMIDVLMFNSVHEIKRMLRSYKLV